MSLARKEDRLDACACDRRTKYRVQRLLPDRLLIPYFICRDTRLTKLDAPDSPFAAVALAKAGMVRLG